MACITSLPNIVSDCESSRGGILEVYIALRSDVESVAYATDTETGEKEEISGITMVSGKKFKKYDFRKNTASMTSTLNVGDYGTYVSTDITMTFSKMETQKRLAVAALAIADLAVITKDANGVYWMLGAEEPVNSSAGEGQTGTQRSDGNYYSITLQDNASTYPFEVPESVVKNVTA